MANQHLRNLLQGKDPPGMISKTSIIGKSFTGQPVVSFDTIEAALRWVATGKPHRLKFFRQTITEEEVELGVPELILSPEMEIPS